MSGISRWRGLLMASLISLRDLPGGVMETTLLLAGVDVDRLAVKGRRPGRGLLARRLSLALRRCGGGDEAHVPSILPGTGSCRSISVAVRVSAAGGKRSATLEFHGLCPLR
mgnify:CR=1 FL=1